VIGALRGTVVTRSINRVLLDVNGVGYDVAAPLSTIAGLPESGEIFLHIYTLLRENSLELYGFSTLAEKAVFVLLISVSGVGPKMALTILSGMPPKDLRDAVFQGNVRRFTSIPGIGRKTAERVILELKEKLKSVEELDVPPAGGESGGNIEADLVSSLVNLGYKERHATEAARRVLADAAPNVALDEAVRQALRELMK
jgi:Holliday junction DNA helicase RuvA